MPPHVDRIIDHAHTIETLELIEAHVRAQGQAAQFTYFGILGGTDAAVTVGKHVELSSRRIGEGTQLAVLAQTPEAIETALEVIDGIEVEDDDEHVEILGAFRRGLIATRDRWPALERDAPRSLRRGHTIDPQTGGLHPTHTPPLPPREPRSAVTSTCEVLGDLGGCELPCQLLELISIADVGCL